MYTIAQQLMSGRLKIGAGKVLIDIGPDIDEDCIVDELDLTILEENDSSGITALNTGDAFYTKGVTRYEPLVRW